MKKTVDIGNEIALQTLIGDMRAEYQRAGFLRATYSTDKPRTLSQNAIAAVWYGQVERELREDTAAGVKRYCKLHYGVPIMRADDEEFRSLYDTAIKPLPYEKKLLAMGLMPLTSLMDTGQLSRYLVDMKEGFRGRVDLRFPLDYAYAAPRKAA
jgi:hypothetical protein